MSEFRLSLSYELYVFSPEWRCRTHKLLIKAHFRPIFDTMHNLLRLKYTSIRISEVFQISWIPSLFSMQNPVKIRRRPHNGFVEWAAVHYPFHWFVTYWATLLTGCPSSSCEMIILRNNSHGGIIRVCMGIFTTALRN